MLRTICCVGTTQSFELYGKWYVYLPLRLKSILTVCYYRTHASLLNTAVPVTSDILTAVLQKTAESSGMWCCRWASSSQCFEHRSAFIMQIKLSKMTAWPWRWRHCNPPKCQKLPAYWHCVTSQDISWGHELETLTDVLFLLQILPASVTRQQTLGCVSGRWVCVDLHREPQIPSVNSFVQWFSRKLSYHSCIILLW
jgi:hypothetical protein